MPHDETGEVIPEATDGRLEDEATGGRLEDEATGGRLEGEATRTLVVWWPDWPLTAAGLSPEVPAAVLHANRVVVCSDAARAEGVRRGLRRREAQARCPELMVLDADPARDVRTFEPVARAIEDLVPAVELRRPGLVALATRGPSRAFGGDETLAGRLTEAARAASPGGLPPRAGVAAGTFAATLAARGSHLVSPGATRAFLAPEPVSVLGRPELGDLLRRLGIRTLGDLAALPDADVADRFGPEGVFARRLAAGLDERPVVARTPPPDLTARTELDPPADRVELVAFAAKALADDLVDRLRRRGLACTRVVIEVETEHDESLARRWRGDGPLTATAIAERVRWQLDGWLTGTAAQQPTGPITLLRLVPDELVPADGDQQRLWGAPVGQPDRVGRALARVQGMLGTEAVMTAALRGGRDPGDRITLRPWDGVPAPEAGHAAPWPGQVPPPYPATVFTPPLPAVLFDAAGAPVQVTGRRELSAVPHRLRVTGDLAGEDTSGRVSDGIVSSRAADGVEVVGWTGPWPADERWWDDAGRRRARFQVATSDGRAWLVALEGGRWHLEAVYD